MGLEIELSDYETEYATLDDQYVWQVVEIVLGGFLTIHEVCLMCFLMSLRRLVKEGSVSTNLFHPMQHHVDPWTVQDGIQLLGNIFLKNDTFPPGVQLTLCHGWCPSFGICFVIYLSLLHKFNSQSIGFCFCLFASLPE